MGPIQKVIVFLYILYVQELIGDINKNKSCPVFIHRRQWLAGKVKSFLMKIRHSSDIIIENSPSPWKCTNLAQCSLAMKEMQKHDQTFHKLNDIRYNFCLGGDGNVYVGTGKYTAFPHKGTNNDLITYVCLIGDILASHEDNGALRNISTFLNCLKKEKFLRNPFKVLVSSQKEVEILKELNYYN